MKRDQGEVTGCILLLYMLFLGVSTFYSFFSTSLSWMIDRISLSWIIGIVSIISFILAIRFRYLKKSFKEKESSLRGQAIHLESELKRTKEYADKKDEIYKSFEKRDDIAIKGLTELYSDLCTIQDYYTEMYLRNKKHPAPKQALGIKEIRAEKRALIEQNKILIYKYELLFKAFPELSRYVDSFEDLKTLLQYKDMDSVKEGYDHVQDYVSKEDYSKLSITSCIVGIGWEIMDFIISGNLALKKDWRIWGEIL